MPKKKSPYYYDEQAGEQAVQWIESLCRHCKGEWTGQPLILAEWQKERIIKPVFGWKRVVDDLRQYSTLYVEMPRKNAKTTLAAAIMLKLLCNDGEEGGEVYSAAGEKEQARIVYDIARSMIELEPELSKRLTVMQKQITYLGEKVNSKFVPLSKEAKSKHGYNASAIIIDELHVHESRDLYDVLDTSTGSRRQPLTVILTTAGIAIPGKIGYETSLKARKILKGELKDDTFLPVVYAADPDTLDSDLGNPELWAACNPGYPISPKHSYLEKQYIRTLSEPLFKHTFKRLHLNIWTSETVGFIDTAEWAACGADLADWDNDIWRDVECTAAFDLASKRDISGFCLLFDMPFGYVPRWFLYLPEDTLKKREQREQVQQWVDAGWIKTTPGGTTDYDYIQKDFEDCLKKYNIQRTAFDPWNSSQLITNLDKSGDVVLVEFPQTYKYFSQPTKDLEAFVLDRKIQHEGNPVAKWALSNVAILLDPNDNIRPSKKHSMGKIDPVVMLIMALSLMLYFEDTEHESQYDQGKGLVSL